jgi:hypothetical protein
MQFPGTLVPKPEQLRFALAVFTSTMMAQGECGRKDERHIGAVERSRVGIFAPNTLIAARRSLPDCGRQTPTRQPSRQ